MSVALKDGYAGQEGGGAYRHGVQYVGRLSAHPLLEGDATLHDHTRRQRLAAAVCECAVLVAMHAVQAQPCGRERRRVLRAPLRVEVLRLEEKLYGDLASSMHAPCKLYDRVFCTAAERVSAAVHRGVGGGRGKGRAWLTVGWLWMYLALQVFGLKLQSVRPRPGKPGVWTRALTRDQGSHLGHG